MFLVAPAGWMKSELCMSLDGAHKIHCTTSLTAHALISGMNFGGHGDPSLIPKLNGKTLVVKDFTTILSMNLTAQEEIFGTLRDAYDGKISREFGNGVVRRYKSTFGILAGVTPAIEAKSAGHSVLGERFLKYRPRGKQLLGGHDAIDRTLTNLKKETRMRDELQAIAADCLARSVDLERDAANLDLETAGKIKRLAQWTAAMRGAVARERYTQQLQFRPVAEVGTRLAKQLAMLGLGIACFKREDHVSEDTYQTLARVARDTAPDRVESIVNWMYRERGADSCTPGEVTAGTKIPIGTVRPLLEDMSLLHIVVAIGGSGMGQEYQLSEGMYELTKTTRIYQRRRRTCARDGRRRKIT
jgi:hypothetical protein